jgi:hypothetical protein
MKPSRLLALVALLAVLACGQEPRPPLEPAPPTPPPAAAPPPALAEEPPDPTPEELPIADDFAAQAEQAIDDKSYRAELDALEREINAESIQAVP